jgi:hypothetical protein
MIADEVTHQACPFVGSRPVAGSRAPRQTFVNKNDDNLVLRGELDRRRRPPIRPSGGVPHGDAGPLACRSRREHLVHPARKGPRLLGVPVEQQLNAKRDHTGTLPHRPRRCQEMAAGGRARRLASEFAVSPRSRDNRPHGSMRLSHWRRRRGLPQLSGGGRPGGTGGARTARGPMPGGACLDTTQEHEMATAEPERD